jgi:hypothetical protein
MCHVGGPLGYGPYAGMQDEVFALWKSKIIELATCPNVMKLGGMINRLAAYDYRALPAPVSSTALAAYWRPYMETSSNGSGQTVVCSRAISPWKRWGSAGRCCGTRSNGIAQAPCRGEAILVQRYGATRVSTGMIPRETLIS